MEKFFKYIFFVSVLCILSSFLSADEMLTGQEYINRLNSFRPSKNIRSLYENPKTGEGYVEVRGEVVDIFEFGSDRYFTLHLKESSKTDPLSFIYINVPRNTEINDIRNQSVACVLKWDIISLSKDIIQAAPFIRDEHYNIEFFSYLPGVEAIEAEIKSRTNIRQYGKPADFVMPAQLATPQETNEKPIKISDGKLKVYNIIKSVNPKLTDGIADAYADFVITYSLGHGVDPLFLCAIITQESRFRNSATSRAGAQGLGQLMPMTAKGLGISDPYDPEQNIFGTAKYVKNVASNLFSKKARELTFSELKLVLASYNAGPNAVKKYKGIPPYSETRNYVVKVLNNYVKYLNL